MYDVAGQIGNAEGGDDLDAGRVARVLAQRPQTGEVVGSDLNVGGVHDADGDAVAGLQGVRREPANHVSGYRRMLRRQYLDCRNRGQRIRSRRDLEEMIVLDTETSGRSGLREDDSSTSPLEHILFDHQRSDGGADRHGISTLARHTIANDPAVARVAGEQPRLEHDSVARKTLNRAGD